VARALGEERWLLRSEIGRQSALTMLGRIGELSHTWDDMVTRGEALNDPETLLEALANAAELSMLTCEFERSRDYRERELVEAERLGTTFLTAAATANLAQVAVYRGDWQEGRHWAERALELFSSIGSDWGSVFAFTQLGIVALREGAWEEASTRFEKLIAIARTMGDLQGLRYGNQALAELDLLQGHPEEAIVRLEPLLDRPGFKEHDVTFLLPTLAWAHLELGDVERAQQVVTDAIERLENEGNRREMPDALRIKGIVLSRQGRWDEAEKAFEEAVSLAKGMPEPYAEARALYERGLMLRSSGRDGSMGAVPERHLQDALAIFRRLGAQKDVERTEQALG
jgi:tetratricopeptide (TPR) repeat protein